LYNLSYKMRVLGSDMNGGIALWRSRNQGLGLKIKRFKIRTFYE